jgi:hypothetical protein
MSFRGRTFASLFTQAAENATSSVRTVKGVNHASTQVARAVSSGRGVGTSSGVRAVLEKPKMVTEMFDDIPGIRTDLFSRTRDSWDEILEDLDYALGPRVIHASNQEGLSTISPMKGSAHAIQGQYGLDAESSVAFAYNPESIFYNDNAAQLAGKLAATAGEASTKTGSPTVYMAKAPLSGLSNHPDLADKGWYMSFKPLRTLDSEPLQPGNTRRIEDMIRRVTGEASPEEKLAELQAYNAARAAERANKPSVA